MGLWNFLTGTSNEPDDEKFENAGSIQSDDDAYELLRWMAKEREKMGLWSRSEEEDHTIAYGEAPRPWWKIW